MSIVRQERIALFAENMNSNGKTVRSPHFATEFADFAVVLLDITETGTPSGSESVTFYLLHVDDDGNEYVDANTTHGTVAVTGSDAPVKKAFVVPYLSKYIAIKAVAAGTLSVSTAFTVSARVVLVANTDFPDEYET